LKQPFFIALSNSRRYRELQELKDLLADDNRYLHEELQRISGDEIVGGDFGLKEVMKNVRSVAALSSPVLLLGDTGVGKEIIAGAIHHSSSGDTPTQPPKEIHGRKLIRWCFLCRGSSRVYRTVLQG